MHLHVATFFLWIFLALSGVVSVSAQAVSEEAGRPEAANKDPRAKTGGAQTREEIMARQRGLNVQHTYRLTIKGSPPPAHDTSGKLGTRGGYSDAEIWRQIRNGSVATSSSGTASGQLMQVLGEDWRLIRETYIIPYSAWIIVGMVGLLILFYLIRGQIKIRGGRAGTTIHRFSMSHRIVHWLAACVFILMAISGLIILLGRPLLAPLIGKEANAILASAALQGHNLFGPVFIVALVLLAIRFMKGNFFQRADIGWILKGGGLIGGHASSRHYNFGEKTWYWVLVLVGLMISVTGILLEFPWLIQTLAWHQAATILHAVGAIVLIVFAMGHIYVGTIGMEGALDSMLIGEVDENWAKEHHDLWYEEVTGKPANLDRDEPGGRAVPVPESA